MTQTQVQLIGNVSTGANFVGVVTASSFVGDGSGLTGVGIGTDGSVNTSGIITTSSFVGDGSGLTGVGIGTDGSVNTSGIITASTIVANQFSGVGDKLIFSPTVTSFSPVDGATDVSFDTNIVITFNQPIYAGVGSIFLRNSSGIGTIIEAIGIGSTTQISINNQTLTINPSSNLPNNTDVYVVLPQGIITNAVGGNNSLLDTYNFNTLNFVLSSINPTNGATNVGLDTNITLSFSNAPTRGTGTITLRSGSAGGTTIESFDAATSPRISVVGNDWILDPTSNFNYSTTVYTVIPSTAINNYVGLNTTGADSHSFTTQSLNLGDAYEGGYLICQSGGTRWVVAPASTNVVRNWYSRSDAVTRAQQVSGCTGWFVPTCAQLLNPGHSCRIYWDSFDHWVPGQGRFWSNTEISANAAYVVNVGGGYGFYRLKTYCNSAVVSRAFRCVTY